LGVFGDDIDGLYGWVDCVECRKRVVKENFMEVCLLLVTYIP
jgi:hypothetical protein